MSGPGRISRRGLAFGAAGVTGLLALGAAGLFAKPESLVRGVVTGLLPGVPIDEASLRQFEQDYNAEAALAGMSVRKLKALGVVQQVVGLRLLRIAPGVGERFRWVERDILTKFMTRSNFFLVPDPRKETIVYVGDNTGCENPFARRYGQNL